MGKSRVIFVFFNLIALAQGKIEAVSDVHSLSQAAGNLIVNVMKESEMQIIRINMAMSKNSSMENADVGNELTKISFTKFKVLTRGSLRGQKPHEKRRSPIILTIDSIGTFELIKSRIEHDLPKFYLVLLTKGLLKEIDEILKVFWKNSVSDVNFLVANQSAVFMYTFFPFANGKCGTNLSLVHINSFDVSTETWSCGQFFPNKVDNLNGCVMRVGMIVNVPLVIADNRSLDGIEVTIVREMARAFNFSSQFEKPFESVGSIYANGSSTGLLGAVYKRTLDMAIGTLSLQIDRTNFISATTSFATIPIVIVIPPTPQISPFTKLYLPFDLTTWSLLLAMFFIGYVVIIFTKFFASTLYRLIVGRNVNYPFTNMFIAFFGNAQSVLPSANFSRFLLAKFLIFCLVIRGLYQGKLFDIMQKEIHEKEPTTIDDLMNGNYAFYTYESLSRRVKGQPFESKVKVIKNAQLENYRQRTLDSTFRGVVFSYEYQAVYLNFLHRKDFSYKILDERFVTNQMVFYMQENHFLVEEIGLKIDWLRDFGILHHIISKYVDPAYLKAQPPGKAAKSLHFRELSAIFGLWLAGLGVSFIVFVVEVGVGCKKPLRGRKKSQSKA